VGKYTAADKIGFTGTPPYDLVLKHETGSTIIRSSGRYYDVPTNYTVQSFTDKTGAPGKLVCIPSTPYSLTASASGFCAGEAGVTFALSGTENGRSYQLYRDDATVVATLEGTGSAATFSNAVNVADTYTARTADNLQYCPATMHGTISVTAHVPGAVGQAPDAACGCAAGLTDCSGTCTTSCGNYTSCGFTDVYPAGAQDYAIGSDHTVNNACYYKGYRLPTIDELKCMCEDQQNVPGGLRSGYYNSDAYAAVDSGLWRRVINMATCAESICKNCSIYVKCVK
jgi:hypothetical protein